MFDDLVESMRSGHNPIEQPFFRQRLEQSVKADFSHVVIDDIPPLNGNYLETRGMEVFWFNCKLNKNKVFEKTGEMLGSFFSNEGHYDAFIGSYFRVFCAAMSAMKQESLDIFI